jgi:hypothetical protein
MYAWRFLTFWMVISVIFHKWTHEYIDLLYFSFVCLAVGSYISFVGPGVYKYGDVEFKGLERFIVVDMAIHLFFFIFVYWNYYNYYKGDGNRTFFVTLLIVLSFSTFVINPESIYLTEQLKLFTILTLATVLYFFL